MKLCLVFFLFLLSFSYLESFIMKIPFTKTDLIKNQKSFSLKEVIQLILILKILIQSTFKILLNLYKDILYLQYFNYFFQLPIISNQL